VQRHPHTRLGWLEGVSLGRSTRISVRIPKTPTSPSSADTRAGESRGTATHSQILTCLNGSSSTLPALRSRCTIWRECKYLRGYIAQDTRPLRNVGASVGLGELSVSQPVRGDGRHTDGSGGGGYASPATTPMHIRSSRVGAMATPEVELPADDWPLLPCST
jgi:hypothetical protein